MDAIELDYVALNRDFLFTTMGQLYRRLINILSYGHEEILYIINLIIQVIIVDTTFCLRVASSEGKN